MAFLKPWCSSLIASRFLDETHGSPHAGAKTDCFTQLSEVCQRKNDNFYSGVDEKVTKAELERAGGIAADAPTGEVRQDQGAVPHMKFFRLLGLRAPFSADHEAAVAHGLALLGQALERPFEADVRKIFAGSSAKVVTVAPKTFQRMQNKLLNPKEHGDPNLRRPRCAKNVDVLRGCIIVKTVKELEDAYNTLKAAVKVVRVKNTHDPSKEGFRGGYRSLLVNFLYEPGVKWVQLFGEKVTFEFSDLARNRLAARKACRVEGRDTHLGNLWCDYVDGDTTTFLKLLGLQGLQSISSENPDEPVQMIAELQIVLEPYFEGRTVSHMLFKIARCDTGAMEMVRDFYQEYYHKIFTTKKGKDAVQDIAMAAREGREPPERVEQGAEDELFEAIMVG